MKIDFRSDTSAVWDLYQTFSGELAFDIGANGGAVTQILAEHFAHVVALEPAKESFDELAALNLPNVACNRIAVSDRDGSVTLQEAELALEMGELVTGIETSPLARGWGAQTGTRNVASITIDSLTKCYGAPDFIKIDVEGHEGHVCQGGLRTFAEHSPTLLIEIHAGSLGEAIQAILDDYHWTRFNHEIYAARQSPLLHEHYWLLGSKP